MGLSAFEDSSSMSPYCCSSIDRSLTNRLIETSNIPLKSSYRFCHTPEWADGLDLWSSVGICSTIKNDINRRQFDFHCDLGLFLPRHEKPSSAPTSFKNLQSNPKLSTNHLPPERIRILLKKEKDLLLQNDLINQSVISTNLPPPVPLNTLRQSNSLESSSTGEIRLPLCHTRTRSSTPPSVHGTPPLPPPVHPNRVPQLNQDALKCLLKEHLTTLLTRGASTMNANRSLVNLQTNEQKQTKNDSKLLEERFSKLDELISSQQSKTNQTSSIIFHPRSTLGLTITPVDLNPQKNSQTITLERMAQQRTFLPDSENSSAVSSRPSTQPVPMPMPPTTTTNHLFQQQRMNSKRNLETINSAPGDFISSNESSNNKVSESQRRGQSNNRSSSKNGIHRTIVPTTTTTIELLPPIISGKRLHIPLANHRHL